MVIDAGNLNFSALNRQIRAGDADCEITGCLGQRFIGAGMSGKRLTIHGIPGNALGAYLGDSEITVYGNAQDALGDTMNAGRIVVHGDVGDATGYAMRGGAIYVRGNAGYRAGIHMKAYEEKQPVLVIGGRAGSFLGEYQAGGLILVLGLHTDGKPIVGNFPCTGMHGGTMILRGDVSKIHFPHQTKARTATEADLAKIKPYLDTFCKLFGFQPDTLLRAPYTIISPDNANPYRQMYVAN